MSMRMKAFKFLEWKLGVEHSPEFGSNASLSLADQYSQSGRTWPAYR